MAAQLVRRLAEPSATARLLAGLVVVHWAQLVRAPAPPGTNGNAASAALPAPVVQAVFDALAVPGALRP